MSVFEEGGKTKVPGEKNLGARMRTNNKLSPHMMPSSELNLSDIDGRRVLTPLHHPCSLSSHIS